MSEKTLGRIMHELGTRSFTVKKFRVNATDLNHALPVAPNFLNQDSMTFETNKVWADIAYIRTAHGRMYLASILDLRTVS